jgi:hypothetical protein
VYVTLHSSICWTCSVCLYNFLVAFVENHRLVVGEGSGGKYGSGAVNGIMETFKLTGFGGAKMTIRSGYCWECDH